MAHLRSLAESSSFCTAVILVVPQSFHVVNQIALDSLSSQSGIPLISPKKDIGKAVKEACLGGDSFVLAVYANSFKKTWLQAQEILSDHSYRSVCLPFERSSALLYLERKLRQEPGLSKSDNEREKNKEAEEDAEIEENDDKTTSAPPTTPTKEKLKGKEKQTPGSSSKKKGNNSESSAPGDETLPKYLVGSLMKCFPDQSLAEAIERDFSGAVIPLRFSSPRAPQEDFGEFKKRMEGCASMDEIPEVPDAQLVSVKDAVAAAAVELEGHFRSLAFSETMQVEVLQEIREAFQQGRAGFRTGFRHPDLQRLAMWATTCGQLEGDDFWINSNEDLFDMFSQGHQPPWVLDTKHPLLIVMAGLPGLGKSLLSNAVSVLANTGRVCQDEVGDRPKLIKGVVQGFEKNNVMIADRNNHTFKHRKAVMEEVKKFVPQARIVLVSMKVEEDRSKTIQISQQRIKSRKGHPTLSAESPTWMSILASMLREYQAPNYRGSSATPRSWTVPTKGEEDADFMIDGVVTVDPLLAPAEGVSLILRQLRELFSLRFPVVSEEEISRVVEGLLAQEQAAEGGQSTSAASPASSPSRSPGGSKKSRLPSYYGIHLGADCILALRDLVDSRPSELKPLSAFLNQKPLTNDGGPHITLLFFGRRGDPLALPEGDQRLFQVIQENISADVEVKVTHIAQNDKCTTLVADIPEQYRGEKSVYHITLATSPDTPPVYSNTLLDSLMVDKSGKEGGKLVAVNPPFILHGAIQGMF